MKKVVAIYEKEEAYGKNLAEYVNRRENVPFEVQVFSKPDKLSAYLEGHTPQLLLLSEENSLDAYGKISEQAEEVWYLTGRREFIQKDCIYKYQPTDQILNQLMKHFDEKENDSLIAPAACPIYGVYSPVGRCGKTTFSLLLAEILSRKKSVLYIGFDEFFFLDLDDEIERSQNQKEKGTLSDAYFYAQRENFSEKMPQLVSHWHGIDLLTGMNCSEDLCAIQASEWARLVEKIANEIGYSAIVLDIGTRLWLADSLFLLCSQIYVPTISERLAKDQLAHFEDWLERNGKKYIQERMQTVELPKCAQNGTIKEQLEYALWGETGDYVRSFIKSEW